MSYVSYGSFGKKDEPIIGNVIEIQSIDEKMSIIKNAKSKGQLMVVDIWGSWCGPCKQSRPGYEKLSIKYPSVIFCAEDVTKEISPEVTAVPWFQFFGNGDLLESTRGADIEAVEKIILKYLQKHPANQTFPPVNNYGSNKTGWHTNPNITYNDLVKSQNYFEKDRPPSMGQHPSGNSNLNNPSTQSSYETQRHSKIPHGVRGQAHRPIL